MATTSSPKSSSVGIRQMASCPRGKCQPPGALPGRSPTPCHPRVEHRHVARLVPSAGSDRQPKRQGGKRACCGLQAECAGRRRGGIEQRIAIMGAWAEGPGRQLRHRNRAPFSSWRQHRQSLPGKAPADQRTDQRCPPGRARAAMQGIGYDSRVARVPYRAIPAASLARKVTLGCHWCSMVRFLVLFLVIPGGALRRPAHALGAGGISSSRGPMVWHFLRQLVTLFDSSAGRSARYCAAPPTASPVSISRLQWRRGDLINSSPRSLRFQILELRNSGGLAWASLRCGAGAQRGPIISLFYLRAME